MRAFWCAWGQHLVSYRGTGTLLPGGYRICKDCRITAAQLPDDAERIIRILAIIWGARATLREVDTLDSRLRGKV